MSKKRRFYIERWGCAWYILDRRHAAQGDILKYVGLSWRSKRDAEIMARALEAVYKEEKR